VTVTVPDVELQNMIVIGNLVIDPAVGEGRTSLSNVTVTGELVMLGGNSLTLRDSQVQKLIVNKSTGAATIYADGWTHVWHVCARSESQLEEMVPEDVLGFGHVYYANNQGLRITGSLLSLTLEESGGLVNLAYGQIARIYVETKAAGTVLNLAKGTEVAVLDLMAPIQIRGNGTVALAMIYADGAQMEKAPLSYQFSNGTFILVAGQTVNDETLAQPEPEPEPAKPVEPKPQQPTQPTQPTQTAVIIHALSTMSVEVGKTGTQKVTVSPSDADITVTSSNTAAATVTLSGNTITVTGVASGQATIYVKATKSGYTDGGATFKVDVKAPTSTTPDFTFQTAPGLVDPSKTLVIVTLQVSDPQNYIVRMKDGSNYVTLTYRADLKVFSGEVNKDIAVRANVRISQ
jgi:hypothetical protein